MKKAPILIAEDSAFFRKGQVLEDYEPSEDGILSEGMFVRNSSIIRLTESLTAADEKRVKEIIRSAFKQFFWKLYTNQSIVLS